MKKLYHCAIFTCIILSISVCGCGVAEQKDVAIEQSAEIWEITDIQLQNFSSDISYVAGVTQEGVYYVQDIMEDNSLDKGVETWHLLTFSGEDKLLYQEDIRSTEGRYHNFCLNGKNLLMSTSFGEDIKVFELSPDAEAREIFYHSWPMPYLQTSQSYILSIRSNPLNRDEWENELVLLDKASGEEMIIYQSIYNNNDATGEYIRTASVSDEKVFFTIEITEDKQTQYWLYTYDIAEQKIMDKVSLERPISYAVCMNDSILLSENDSVYLEEAGRIGKNTNGVFEETAKLPLITASNMIRDGLWVEDGVFLKSYKSGYFWKKKSNTIYVCDFTQMNDGDCVVGDYYIIEDGFVCVIQKEDGYYVRQIELK